MHTQLLYAVFITYCYIHLTNYRVIWETLVLSFLWDYNYYKTLIVPFSCFFILDFLDIKRLTNTSLPLYRGFPSLLQSVLLTPSLHFRTTCTNVQLNPHGHAICSYSAKLAAVLSDYGWGDMNSVVQSLSSRPNITLKSYLKNNIHITSWWLCGSSSTQSDTYRKTDHQFAGFNKQG